MMLLYRPFYCLFLLLSSVLALQPGSCHAQAFTRANHAYWYQPDAPLQNQLLVWQAGSDSLAVVASVNLSGSQSIADYRVLLHLKNKLDSATATGLNTQILLPAPYLQQGNRHLFRTQTPKADSLHYLLLEVSPQGGDSLSVAQHYWSFASLHPDFNFPPPPFYLSQQENDSPLFSTYLPTGTPLRLKGQFPHYTVFQYKEVFEPAAPPMAPPGVGSGSLEVDSTFTLVKNSLFLLREEGLYFFQHDTTSLAGLGIRITNPYFPEVGTLRAFAGPIRYLSTNEEWSQLESAEFSKAALDKFWLKVAQSKERARRIIRSYYQQVAEANALFTNYKEGWKTDQGMIYILYGKPDLVQVQAGKEEWIYVKTPNNPEIKFTFVRVKNPFTDRHYVLMRSKNYTRSHYQIVSQWRRGRKTL
jgi:GWxTD domain-containing protein